MAAFQRAEEYAECAVCFDDLFAQPCGAAYGSDGNRSCGHYCHVSCLQSLGVKACPHCQIPFHSVVPLPDPIANPEAWFRAIDADHDGKLGMEEITEGLKTAIQADWRTVEMDGDRLWAHWDLDGSGHVTLDEFVGKSGGLIGYIREKMPRVVRPAPPSIETQPNEWFSYWDEDNSLHLEKGEVVRALIKTFRLGRLPVTSVVETVEAIWPIFDHDMSGTISKAEFSASGGLSETITATLRSPH